MHVSEVVVDLLAEQSALDEIVGALTPEQWSADTASPRWDVTDQIAHLTYFDHAAASAISDPDGFPALIDELMSGARGGDEAIDTTTLSAVRELAVGDRLEAWRNGRSRLEKASASLADDARVRWYGPSMGAKSFLTARLMEVWAHGQDIVDAVGAERAPTDRLRHIAQLGFITRGWTYANRGVEMPDDEVGVILQSPSGQEWTWGPEGAAATVRGRAEDFCLVVTQRRHLDDTGLRVAGEAALDWLVKAQAFAGPPTDGPAAGSSK